jgi:hypothetical protein
MNRRLGIIFYTAEKHTAQFLDVWRMQAQLTDDNLISVTASVDVVEPGRKKGFQPCTMRSVRSTALDSSGRSALEMDLITRKCSDMLNSIELRRGQAKYKPTAEDLRGNDMPVNAIASKGWG